MSSRVQLFSGGLDSFALWHLLEKPHPVYVCYGHKYQNWELKAIGRLEQADLSLQVTFLVGPQIGHLEQPNGHIPHRNLLLIATAAAELKPAVIYLGALRGETSRDKSDHFIRESSRLLSFCEQPVRVLSPSKRWTKTQLVARFVKKFPEQLENLRNTRSCYAESDLPCGRCLACFRRWVAMRNNDIHEEYNVPPWENLDWRRSRAMVNLWRRPLLDWPGVIQNNLEALRALRKQNSSLNP